MVCKYNEEIQELWNLVHFTEENNLKFRGLVSQAPGLKYSFIVICLYDRNGHSHENVNNYK